MISKKWKTFLQEGLEDYSKAGLVKLYHYSRMAGTDKITLDPERFKTGRNSWSRNEYNRSSFPRVFFYLDKEKTERDIATGEPFVASVSADDIYDLIQDPEDLLAKSKKASQQTVPDYGKIFKSLTGVDRPTPGYEEYFTPIREEGSKIYKGIYYTINYGDTPVVVWFNKIEAHKEREEE